jgi:hypothetical protein
MGEETRRRLVGLLRRIMQRSQRAHRELVHVVQGSLFQTEREREQVEDGTRKREEL